jgi:hypothetical protein
MRSQLRLRHCFERYSSFLKIMRRRIVENAKKIGTVAQQRKAKSNEAGTRKDSREQCRLYDFTLAAVGATDEMRSSHALSATNVSTESATPPSNCS